MYSKISAEFDSIDSAELAAKAVKSAGGIKRVSIYADPENFRPPVTGRLFEFTSFSTQNSALPIAVKCPDFSSNFRRAATVEVVCESEYKSEVQHRLISKGGLKPHRNGFQ